MRTTERHTCTAFIGTARIATGDLTWVALAVKEALEADNEAQALIFDDSTSRIIEIDFRGNRDDVLRSVAARDLAGEAASTPEAPLRRPGRPKLGVVSREITLLPRHWDWLGSQPGGASVTLRRLVEEARRSSDSKDKVRQAQDAAYRFMMVMAGDLPGFEEATRALFAGNLEQFRHQSGGWPVDVRDHAYMLAAHAFDERAA
ncbi:DUF2239 family protein [Emcibacter sp. SYSU 3D8]|uniref:DUF2239 family protein n=1 Tax=Emcibacter sp. SYSU 3D8 TaxID=3133969 RepID=UPI0031FE98BB